MSVINSPFVQYAFLEDEAGGIFLKKDYWQDHKSKEGKNWGAKYKSSFKPYRKRHSGKRGRKFLVFAGLAIIVVALFQFNVFSWEGVKNAGGSVATATSGAFQGAVSWGKDKLGVEDSGTELALPVTSGVVVEEYGLVVNADGEENYHSGVDIQVPEGSEILAAAAGEVTNREEKDDGTIWLTLQHDENWSTVYGRLGEATVEIGDKVEQGDVLGKPKSQILHFEVLEQGKARNPVGYFNN